MVAVHQDSSEPWFCSVCEKIRSFVHPSVAVFIRTCTEFGSCWVSREGDVHFTKLHCLESPMPPKGCYCFFGDVFFLPDFHSTECCPLPGDLGQAGFHIRMLHRVLGFFARRFLFHQQCFGSLLCCAYRQSYTVRHLPVRLSRLSILGQPATTQSWLSWAGLPDFSTFAFEKPVIQT